MLAFQALVVALAIAEVRPLALCTGASTKLPAGQCAAWQAFWDGAHGNGDWNSHGLGCTRTDPCKSYKSGGCANGNNNVCNDEGTAITWMCVPRTRAPTAASLAATAHCRCRALLLPLTVASASAHSHLHAPHAAI
jgi:hypothetical protein